jgi:hypothetical protein
MGVITGGLLSKSRHKAEELPFRSCMPAEMVIWAKFSFYTYATCIS